MIHGGAFASFGVLARGTNGTFRGPREHLALETRLTVALGGGQEYLLSRRKVDNTNSGYKSMSLLEVDNANRFQHKACHEYFVVRLNATKGIWFP